jgi:NAD(P)-dependent dehydrogenase (short-subunit alcohol dehydrogenase family)
VGEQVAQQRSCGQRARQQCGQLGGGDLAEKCPDTLLALALAVTDAPRREEAVREAVKHSGRIDVVVNNAGYASLAPIEDSSMDDFSAQVEAVFFGTAHVTKAALPYFRGQGGGHFVQVTTSGGGGTAPGAGAYRSAKFAGEGSSGVLDDEARHLGVKITPAEPGGMRTDRSGSSMNVRRAREAYAPTVGAVAGRLRSARGREPTDPVKVARVFLDVASMDDPPLQLLLGSYTVRRVREDVEKMMAQDARRSDVAASVDFG